MDRVTVNYGQVPLETDLLQAEQFAMTGLAKLSEAVLGTGTVVAGFTLAPTAPASLSATLGAGQIYEVENLEATAWSSLPVNTHSIVKQGLALDPQVLTFVPPTTAGYAQYALVEATYADQDTGAVVRPYYNAANPSVPFSGPGNAGTADNTQRKGGVSISIKYGVATTSGSQIAPAPDPGYVGLFLVSLAYGQTTISSGQITLYNGGAAFIPVTLPAVPAGVQSGAWTYGQDQGVSGALAVPLAPLPSALTVGMSIRVRALNPAKGSDSLTVVGTPFGALSIQRRAGLLPQANDWAAGDVLTLTLLPGNVWQLAGLVPSDVAALDAAGGFVVRVTDAANASTSDVLVGSTVAPLAAYVSNAIYVFTQGAAANQTATPTGNVTPPSGNALGAIGFVKRDGSPLAPGDIPANATVLATWNAATNKFRVIGAAPSDIFGLEVVFAQDSGGQTDAISATPTPAVTSYRTGQFVVVQKGPLANTSTTPTLALSGLAPRPLTRSDGTPLQPGDLPASSRFQCIYDGTAFRYLGLTLSKIALQTQAGQANYVSLSNANNIYSGTLNPAPPALTADMVLTFNFTSANTGAAQINLGFGNAPVVRANGQPVQSGDLVGFIPMAYSGTGGAWVSLIPLASDIQAIVLANAPQIPTANATFYVDSTNGSDSTGNGTSAKPFATIAGMRAYVASKLVYSSFNIVAQLLTAGNYASPAVIMGIPNFVIQGNASSPGNYVITGSVASGGGLVQPVGCNLTLNGVTLNVSSTQNFWAAVGYGASLNISNSNFTGSVSSIYPVISVGAGGTATIGSGCTVNGVNASAMYSSSNGGQIFQTGAMTLSNTPTFNSAFAVSTINAGVTITSSASFSGSASGSQYLANDNAIIFNGTGANLPGSSAGTATSGKYVTS